MNDDDVHRNDRGIARSTTIRLVRAAENRFRNGGTTETNRRRARRRFTPRRALASSSSRARARSRRRPRTMPCDPFGGLSISGANASSLASAPKRAPGPKMHAGERLSMCGQFTINSRGEWREIPREQQVPTQRAFDATAPDERRGGKTRAAATSRLPKGAATHPKRFSA